MNDAERVERAERVLGHQFEDKRLVIEALTHRAVRNDHRDRGYKDYERLEYLGDAILDFIVADRLYRKFPKADEGELTQRRAAYVSEPALAAAAERTGLAELVLLSNSQRKVGDEKLPSILSDIVESTLAAVYLDGGLEAAAAVVDRVLGELESGPIQQHRDVKSDLQERLQRVLGEAPEYIVTRLGGPDHLPSYQAEIVVRGQKAAQAEGASKKRATRAAAQAAVAELGGLSDAQLRQRFP